jgi:hypothetical protein
MNKIKIDTKMLIGAGGGVAIGFLLLKSKNPLVLMALGIGGGIIASQFKTKEEKIKAIEDSSVDYLEKIKEDIDESLDLGDETSSAEGISFNPRVGYMTPHGQIHEENPVEFMDIGF